MSGKLSRRIFMLSAPLALGACTTIGNFRLNTATRPVKKINPYYLEMYGAINDEAYPVRATDISKIDPIYWRQLVAYPTPYKPGTIVVDLNNYFCYFILENGEAIRYGVGVAEKNTLNFSGNATIGRKAIWPSWTPTPNMMQRLPDRYGHLGGGMKPGPTNPLGPRALYLYRNNQDTFFRLHGTSEEWSIGKNVSSGCVRFLFQDIIDLYNRATVGSKVIVLPKTIDNQPIVNNGSPISTSNNAPASNNLSNSNNIATPNDTPAKKDNPTPPSDNSEPKTGWFSIKNWF